MGNLQRPYTGHCCILKLSLLQIFESIYCSVYGSLQSRFTEVTDLNIGLLLATYTVQVYVGLALAVYEATNTPHATTTWFVHVWTTLTDGLGRCLRCLPLSDRGFCCDLSVTWGRHASMSRGRTSMLGTIAAMSVTASKLLRRVASRMIATSESRRYNMPNSRFLFTGEECTPRLNVNRDSNTSSVEMFAQTTNYRGVRPQYRPVSVDRQFPQMLGFRSGGNTNANHTVCINYMVYSDLVSTNRWCRTVLGVFGPG